MPQRGRCPALLTWNRYFPGGYDQKCRPSFLFRRGAESYDEAYFESLTESAEEPENPRGLDMIKLPWKREARLLEPRPMVNPRLAELETAKEILEEIFHARPAEVEEMIQMRLEEKSWNEELGTDQLICFRLYGRRLACPASSASGCAPLV